MRLENAGKIITNIKFNKTIISLYFKDEKLEISEYAYQDTYLYVGKCLSEEEIALLKAKTLLTKGIEYALKLLKRRIYTEKAISDKLKKKGIPNRGINKIIIFLKNHDLLNDDAFIEDYLEYSKDALIGKNKILKNLEKKGIPENKLKKIKFIPVRERKKAKLLLFRLEKKYSKYAYKNKLAHIYNALIRYGYDKDVARDTLAFIKISEEEELELLRFEYDLNLNRLKNKYVDPNIIKDKLIKTLLRKGFNYSDIKSIMED